MRSLIFNRTFEPSVRWERGGCFLVILAEDTESLSRLRGEGVSQFPPGVVALENDNDFKLLLLGILVCSGSLICKALEATSFLKID